MSSNGTHVPPEGRLAGKVAIITGAGAGFGAKMAEVFVTQGASVVIAEISPKAGSHVESEINAKYSTKRAVFYEANVTSRSSWESLLERAVDEFGKVDIVVNNAGTTYAKKPTHEVTDSEWDKLIDLNMKRIFVGTGVLFPYFVERGSGTVLNTSSVAANRVKDGLVWYGGTKAFVNKITEGLASEYGNHGIRVNSMCPILGHTALASSFMGEEVAPEVAARFRASVPMGKVLEKTDTLTMVANAARLPVLGRSRVRERSESARRRGGDGACAFGWEVNASTR